MNPKGGDGCMPTRRKPWPMVWRILLRAGFVVLALAIVHLLGWRAHVSIVASTTGIPSTTALAGALAYTLLYLLGVLVVPVLVLAAAIHAILDRLVRRGSNKQTASQAQAQVNAHANHPHGPYRVDDPR